MALTIPVGRIEAEAQARQLDARQALLAVVRLLWTVVLAVPYVLGWTLRKLWLGLAMLGTAAVVGWREAARPRSAEGGADG